MLSSALAIEVKSCKGYLKVATLSSRSELVLTRARDLDVDTLSCPRRFRLICQVLPQQFGHHRALVHVSDDISLQQRLRSVSSRQGKGTAPPIGEQGGTIHGQGRGILCASGLKARRPDLHLLSPRSFGNWWSRMGLFVQGRSIHTECVLPYQGFLC